MLPDVIACSKISHASIFISTYWKQSNSAANEGRNETTLGHMKLPQATRSYIRSHGLSQAMWSYPVHIKLQKAILGKMRRACKKHYSYHVAIWLKALTTRVFFQSFHWPHLSPYLWSNKDMDLQWRKVLHQQIMRRQSQTSSHQLYNWQMPSPQHS